MNQNKPTEASVLASDFTFLSLLKFTLPTIGMLLFMGIYTLIDSIFIARYVNLDGLSALNICTPFLYFIVGVTAMIATGRNAIIGRKLGAGDTQGASASFSLLITCSIVFALVLSLLAFLFLTRFYKC